MLMKVNEASEFAILAGTGAPVNPFLHRNRDRHILADQALARYVAQKAKWQFASAKPGGSSTMDDPSIPLPA
jgi:hypothetical protein